MVISAFVMEVPSILGVPKLVQRKDTLSVLRTHEYRDIQYGINCVPTGTTLSLIMHIINMLTGIQREYGAHPVEQAMS